MNDRKISGSFGSTTWNLKRGSPHHHARPSSNVETDHEMGSSPSDHRQESKSDGKLRTTLWKIWCCSARFPCSICHFDPETQQMARVWKHFDDSVLGLSRSYAFSFFTHTNEQLQVITVLHCSTNCEMQSKSIHVGNWQRVSFCNMTTPLYSIRKSLKQQFVPVNSNKSIILHSHPRIWPKNLTPRICFPVWRGNCEVMIFRAMMNSSTT